MKKYMTDIILNVFSSEPAILKPTTLSRIKEEAPPHILEQLRNSNIYLILARPRISFEPSGFILDNETLRGKIKIHTLPQEQFFEFKVRIPGITSFSISDYPHHTIYLNDTKGGQHTFPAFALLKVAQIEMPEPAYLEVLYIGQAFGQTGNRSAIERLSSHSTLQKILADIAEESPNKEVFIATYQFEYHKFLTFTDGTRAITSNDDEDFEHIKKGLEHKFKRKLRISLAEAALIRYFRPRYNTEFKDHFPKKRQKILQKLYELEFQNIVVEMSTEEHYVKTFSHTVKPSYHHIAKFDLPNEAEMKSFFFSDPE